MLKTTIVEALRATLPDIQNQDPFERAADMIIEELKPVITEFITRVLKEYDAYEVKAQEDKARRGNAIGENDEIQTH
jgi:uncharacterized membrane-anchored protein YjiN (DUF445 family)